LENVQNLRQLTVPSLRGKAGGILQAAFSHDGHRVVSSHYGGTITLWSIADESPWASPSDPLPGHIGWVRAVAFGPDGKWLASGGNDGELILRPTDNLQSKSILPEGHRSFIFAITFSPDSKQLASGGGDGMVKIWDVISKTKKCEMKHIGAVQAIAFSPDGEKLASGSGNGAIILWDVTTSPPISQTLSEQGSGVNCMAFSRDGTKLAWGSRDGAIIIWDVKGKRPLHELSVGQEGDQYEVYGLAFGPSGEILVSGSRNEIVMIWDVVTGKDIVRLSGHSAAVYSVVFSPDGRLLVSVDAGGNLNLWGLEK